MKEYGIVKDRLKVLLNWYRIFTSPHTPQVFPMLHVKTCFSEILIELMYYKQKALGELKVKVMDNIEEGRRLLGLDMVIKTSSGQPATEKNTTIVTLYRKVTHSILHTCFCIIKIL